jgi:hypothetical protein
MFVNLMPQKFSSGTMRWGEGAWASFTV